MTTDPLDPLDALRQPRPPAPVAPRPAFAAALRVRVEAALAGDPDGQPETDLIPDPATGRDHDDRSTAMPTTQATAISLTPYLCCQGAADAIDFYVRAFDAVEVTRLEEPSGRIGHAELTIGGIPFDLADEYPEYGVVSPATLGGTPFTLTLEVTDADAVFAQAVAAGATVQREMSDQFYGYRAGQVLDPFGYRWSIRTKLEDLSADELERRFRELDES